MTERVRHNHITRDIKPEGRCPACDLYHQQMRDLARAKNK